MLLWQQSPFFRKRSFSFFSCFGGLTRLLVAFPPRGSRNSPLRSQKYVTFFGINQHHSFNPCIHAALRSRACVSMPNFMPIGSSSSPYCKHMVSCYILLPLIHAVSVLARSLLPLSSAYADRQQLVCVALVPAAHDHHTGGGLCAPPCPHMRIIRPFLVCKGVARFPFFIRVGV